MQSFNYPLSLVTLFALSYAAQGFANTQVDKDAYLIIGGGTIISMQAGMKGAKKPDKYIYNEDYSLLVKGNVIESIAKNADIKAMVPKGKKVDYLNLKGQTLLPGFIEPHAHLQLTVAGAKFTNLMPCLPDKYQKTYYQDYQWLYNTGKKDKKDNCLLYIDKAINTLANSTAIDGWLIGNGMDPSRMLLTEKAAGLNANKDFLHYPASYFIKYNPDAFSASPAFILDQSGHLGYVNEQAFIASGICGKTFDISKKAYMEKTGISTLSSEDDTFFNQYLGHEIVCQGSAKEMVLSQKMAAYQFGFPDGEWGIVETKPGSGEWVFSGLLKEESSFYPLLGPLINWFAKAPVDTKARFSEQMEQDMLKVLNIASQQGVTTFAEGGGSSQALIESYQRIASRSDMPTRLRTLYTWDAKWDEKSLDKNQLPQKVSFDSGLFSAEGVKLWADGSTQGCSAYLGQDYDEKGLCSDYDRGHQNYDKQAMEARLKKYAENNWYVHIHANGNSAINNAIDALNSLGKTYPSFKALPSVLIHSTVNGDSEDPLTIPKKIAALRNKDDLPNLSTSHLIGHVAYWGASLVNSLGEKRAQHIDPTQTEWKKGIPLSLHSDMAVSPLYPLWFVEQAVSRNTWAYPKLSGEGKPLNNIDEALTPYQALLAVTLHPAMQHNIGDKLGSLEKGKLADMVVLAKNPLTLAKPTEIHNIAVSCTFLNGKQVIWKYPESNAVRPTPNCNIIKDHNMATW